MSWIGWVLLTLAATVVLLRLYLYLQSKRLVGKAAPTLKGNRNGALQGSGTMLIYFHSPDCGPCRNMTPLIEELASSHENVISLDVSRELETAREYGVRAVPTTVLVRDGRIHQVLPGLQSSKKLKSLLRENA